MSMINTMGEIMLRLTPPGNQRFEQSSQFNVFYGGDEANVAVSLSIFNLDVAYITKLPDNPFGDEAINQLRRYGVNTEYIKRGGKRIGINSYEIGAAMRPSRVVYDRANSSISSVSSEIFIPGRSEAFKKYNSSAKSESRPVLRISFDGMVESRPAA